MTDVTKGTLKVITGRRLISLGLQVEWDASTDPEKNTFVDANEEEIVSFIDAESFNNTFDASFDKWAPDVAWSATVQGVVDRLIDATILELDSIQTLVNRGVTNGWWVLLDEIYSFSLSGSNNLAGFKIVTPTNSGATFDINGATFAGGQHIKSGYIPSVDGVKYTLNDAMGGVYIFDNEPTQNTKQFLGGFGVTGERLTLFYQNNPQVSGNINDLGQPNLAGDPTGNLLAMRRENAAGKAWVRDGVEESDDSSSAVGVPNVEMYIGARNNNGTADIPWTGTISIAFFGAGATFPHSDFNTDIRNYLTNLGMTLP